MNAIDLCPEHEQNLRRLAAYLLSDDRQAGFDMDWYDDEAVPERQRTDCGSVGCAVGMAPYAGIRKRTGEDWTEFGNRVFDLDWDHWDWCFRAEWRNSDNTREGAAKRILWLLERGLPEGWESQMNGRVPLCYSDMELTPKMVDWEAVPA